MRGPLEVGKAYRILVGDACWSHDQYVLIEESHGSGSYTAVILDDYRKSITHGRVNIWPGQWVDELSVEDFLCRIISK
jgi:hypothetical protein